MPLGFLQFPKVQIIPCSILDHSKVAARTSGSFVGIRYTFIDVGHLR
jgi:hypothetical protein